MRAGAVLSLWLLLTPLAQAAQHHLLIVGGIGGTDDYRQQFSAAATRLYRSAIEAGLAADNIALLNASPLSDPSLPRRDSDKSTLLQAFDEIAARAAADDRVFVVLIGHGNPRGDGAAFNLPGPDITATELATALDKLANRLIVVVNSASASGPFVRPLSAANRVVISATSSGREYHATLFGDYFIAALGEAGADRNKDERVSMLEAFNFARREVRRAYENEKKLLTEHALLDDNGDGSGSLEPGEFEADGALANRVYLQQPPSIALGASARLVAMIERKRALENSISELKRGRDNLARDDYYAALEELLVDLALLTREIRSQGD